MRLSRFLSLAGKGSRRNADDAIRQGRVEVNGVVVRQAGMSIDPHADRVLVDGVLTRLPSQFSYLILHKPPGYVCSTVSQGRQRSIYHLLEGRWRGRLKYAGRLDADSEGLVLLTDDGELIYRLTHPRFKQTKAYLVRVDRMPDARALERLRKGVMLEDGPTLPAGAHLARGEGGASWLCIEITEGRKRQVRRMCDALGLSVERLVRIGLGPLSLGRLAAGRTRMLTPKEVRSLLRCVGIERTSP